MPTSALAAEETLYLRGAFRRPGDVAPRQGLPGAIRIELHRNHDGTFSGVVPMPPNVVFGRFAVENEAASELDLKDERFWPLLAHDNGVPTREALREQLALISPADVEFGLIAADMLLQYYPDDAVGWVRKLAFKLKTAIGEQRLELRAEYRARLAELSDRWKARGAVDIEGLASLWRYSTMVADTVLAERWAMELKRHSGGRTTHAAAQSDLEVELQDSSPERQLEIFEREWMLAQLVDDFIVAQAFRQASAR